MDACFSINAPQKDVLAKERKERQRQTDRERKKKMKKPPLDSKVGVTAARVLLTGRNVCVSFLPPRVIRLHST